MTVSETVPGVGAGMRAVAAGPRLWRVVDLQGRVVGHLEARGDGPARRFVARRFHVASGSLRSLGEFWSAREAVECLRWSR